MFVVARPSVSGWVDGVNDENAVTMQIREAELLLTKRLAFVAFPAF